MFSQYGSIEISPAYETGRGTIIPKSLFKTQNKKKKIIRKYCKKETHKICQTQGAALPDVMITPSLARFGYNTCL